MYSWWNYFRSKSKRSGRSRSRERGRERSRSRERRHNRSTSRERRKSLRKDRDRSHDRGVSKRERSPDHRPHERKKGKKWSMFVLDINIVSFVLFFNPLFSSLLSFLIFFCSSSSIFLLTFPIPPSLHLPSSYPISSFSSLLPPLSPFSSQTWGQRSRGEAARQERKWHTHQGRGSGRRETSGSDRSEDVFFRRCGLSKCRANKVSG